MSDFPRSLGDELITVRLERDRLSSEIRILRACVRAASELRWSDAAPNSDEAQRLRNEFDEARALVTLPDEPEPKS